MPESSQTTARRRGRPVEPLDRRILRLIDRSGDCWLWTGRVDNKGYGRMTVNQRASLAHRVSYETFVGPIPDGLQIDHLCRVRNCVRPDHLEPVTGKVNMLRAANATGLIAGKPLGGMQLGDVCANGHVLDSDNVWQRRGLNYCLTCRREAARLHASGGKPRQRGYTDHVKVAERAMAQAGTFVLAATYKSANSAYHLVHSVKAGKRVAAYLPAGSFDAKTVKVTTGYEVRVRYLGCIEGGEQR